MCNSTIPAALCAIDKMSRTKRRDLPSCYYNTHLASPETHNLLEPASLRSSRRNDLSKEGVSSTSTYQCDSTYNDPILAHSNTYSHSSQYHSLAVSSSYWQPATRNGVPCTCCAHCRIPTETRPIGHIRQSLTTQTQFTMFYVLHSNSHGQNYIQVQKTPFIPS